MKVSDVLKALDADGWTQVRTKGSHRQFKHPIKPGLVTVAGKPSATFRQGRWQACASKHNWRT